ncbi:MAG TPA: hypothetical protein VF275_01070 [Gammaproteobacteria bacterium]
MMKIPGLLLLAGLLCAGNALAENEIGDPVDFEKYDANEDGYLTETEWSEVPVRVEFHDVDVNRDGQVEEAELLQGYPWHVNEFVDEEPYNDADPEGSFESFDANDDGLLDENEFTDAGWTDDDFDIRDADDDGFLDENEVSDDWFEEDGAVSADDEGAVEDDGGLLDE